MGWAEKTNTAVAKSIIGRRFRLEYSGHRFERKGTRFLKEVRAGLATFFAMAYIISVNASIVSSTGGTCVCTSQTDVLCTTDPEYLKCVQEVNQELVTATAAISAISSIAMGVFANMPIALAPGMGVNAYFTYQVVGFHGNGSVPYRLALTAVFVEGLIFVVLTLLGLRQWLARSIPASLKIASGAGIGLYLALIGLNHDAGIGAITGSNINPLEIAGCVPELRNAITGQCMSGQMKSPTMWLGIVGGGLFTTFLMMYRVKGALCIGILFVSIISWPRNTPFTAFPNNKIGDDDFDFFKRIVAFRPMKHILAAQDWQITGGHSTDFFLAMITFLYVDILDCTGTLYSMARFSGAIDEETQDFEGSAVAYLVDAGSISIGSLFGCPPVTAFIESGAGISEGGATGLTACITGFCFFLSIFFAPIFASIPPWATGCTLILVGAMMARAVVDINWRYIGDSVPAFLTLIIMPFTYSIAYGLIAGIASYIIINGFAWLLKWATDGRIIPYGYENSDYWTPRPIGGILPGWLKRLAHGKRDFWRDYDFDDQEERGRHDSFGAASGSYLTANSVDQGTDFPSTWEMPEMTSLDEAVASEGRPGLSFVKSPVTKPSAAWKR